MKKQDEIIKLNKENTSGILIYIEIQGGEIEEVSLELLSKARELVGEGEPISCIVVWDNINDILPELEKYYIDNIYFYKREGIFQSDIYEDVFVDCINIAKPKIVLFGGTYHGRTLAPRVAVSFRTGVTADCTELHLDKEENLVQIRPAFGGNIMASILTPESRPVIATVRSGVFPNIENNDGHKAKLIIPDFTFANKSTKIIGFQKKEPEDLGIEKEEILVVAGRGVESKEDIKKIRHLAKLLGGGFGSSRGLVEKGFTSHKEQIGLSGHSVSPKCLITFGVSGSVQFLAGIKNAKYIIAINNDEAANIFSVAHLPIQGDLYKILDKMINILEN